MSNKEKLQKLTRLLLPSGRAFQFPTYGVAEKVYNAIDDRLAAVADDAKSLLYSLIPDNDNFSADDATEWERRLGIISNSSVSLSDRKAAILRKMTHPANVKPRQNYRFIEAQLQKAGFDVYVYENIFDDGGGGLETRTADTVFGGAPSTLAVHATTVYHATIQHGGTSKNIVANYINEAKDKTFAIGDNWRYTFFIAGAALTTTATVDADRKDEFRQTILALKPAHMVAFLNVEYT